jgi:tetratricopeptide (TPR) repeat protein
LNPKIAEACARIGELITRHEGDGNKAAEWFRRAAAVAPHTSEGRLNRVRALFVEYKFAEVEQELRRLLALAPHYSEAHYFLGAVLSSAGRYADAIDAFERALQGVARPISISAPIAAAAMAGLTILLFTSSISNPLLAVAPVGMWAKASISPLSELAREAGVAEPVGKADRPHIHRPSW